MVFYNSSITSTHWSRAVLGQNGHREKGKLSHLQSKIQGSIQEVQITTFNK